MCSEDVLSVLIRHIYKAAINPNEWPMFLNLFADTVKGTFTSLVSYDPSSRGGNLSTTIRAHPDDQEKYNRYYVGIDQFGICGATLLRPGRVLQGQQLCPDSVLEKSEFCNDFLNPLNIFNEMCGVIAKSEHLVSVMVTLRSRAFGQFDSDELKLFRVLIPHLQQAVELHRRLSRAEIISSSTVEALSHLSLAFILQDELGAPLLVNDQARLLVEQNDGLRMTRQGLAVLRTDENRLLRKLTCGAARASSLSNHPLAPGGTMTVSRPSLKRAYSVSVIPLPMFASPFESIRNAVVVLISDPETAPRIDGVSLGHRYGLTPSESRIALLLANGRSVTEICESLTITRNTGRTHLKNIFEKLGVRRQSEVVSLLLRSSAATAGHDAAN